VFLLALLAAFILNQGDRVVVGSVEAVESVRNRWVSETHWPSRGWMYKLFSIPVKTGSFDRHAELAYFVALLPILDDGITHRINFDGVLQTDRTPAQYERLYELYRERQSGVLGRLERLEPPPRLRAIHKRILNATAEQIRFYERFMRAKAQSPSLDLRNMLGDPSLSSAAIELRFCGFDAL
jgi:hypothetical protein